MKIIHRNLKQGLVKLRIENLDDLWYLSTVLEKGDLIKAKTERRVKAKDDVIREKSTKETITVGIEVEEVDFSESSALRILGIIKEGPENLVSLGSHHTLNLQEGSVVRIIKERWSGTELQRLKEAERAALRAKILILALEEGEGTLGLLQEAIIRYYDLSRSIGGKYGNLEGREKRKGNFYKDIETTILRIVGQENIAAIIISGPGFEPEKFYRVFLERHPDFREKTFLEKTGSGGKSGIREVIKRPSLEKISQEVNSVKEIQVINNLLEEIGKDSGLAIYGLGDVEVATQGNGVEKLLISDDFFLKNRKRLEELIYLVRNSRGSFHLLNHQGEAGQQLNALGGVAALLRFRIR